MPRSDKVRFIGCEVAAASSRADGVVMSRPARAAGDAKASRLLEGEAASRVLDMADRLLVWLKLLVMAMPPVAGLFAEACCDCAVVEEEAFAAVEGTLRGVWVWAGLLVALPSAAFLDIEVGDSVRLKIPLKAMWPLAAVVLQCDSKCI